MGAETLLMSPWISIADGLPPDTGTPYQVIAACKKELGGNYKGMATRGFFQDWVVRRWPQNFLAWMPAPEHIPVPGSGCETVLPKPIQTLNEQKNRVQLNAS